MKIIGVTIYVLFSGCAATQLADRHAASIIDHQLAVCGKTNLPARTVAINDPVMARDIRTLIRKIQASRFRKPFPSFDPGKIEVLTIRVDDKDLTMAMGRLVDPDKTHGDRFYGGREKHHEKLWNLAIEHLNPLPNIPGADHIDKSRRP